MNSGFRQLLLTVLHQEIERFKTNFDQWKLEAKYDSERIKIKRCVDKLIVLYIPKDVTTNEGRTNVLNKRFAKFRAKKAWCVTIVDAKYSTYNIETYYLHHRGPSCALLYKANEWVLPDGWEDDIDVVCAPGIHFFNHWFAAYYYLYEGPQSELDFYIEDDGSVSLMRLPNEELWKTDVDQIQLVMKDVFDLTIDEKAVLPN